MDGEARRLSMQKITLWKSEAQLCEGRHFTSIVNAETILWKSEARLCKGRQGISIANTRSQQLDIESVDVFRGLRSHCNCQGQSQVCPHGNGPTPSLDFRPSMANPSISDPSISDPRFWVFPGQPCATMLQIDFKV